VGQPNPWTTLVGGREPTSALGLSDWSIGPSSLVPVRIHHLLLSNLTTGMHGRAGAWLRAGVGKVMAKLGSTARPTVIISVDDDGVWKLRTETTFKTHEIHFRLDEEFDETTPDGRKVRVRVYPVSPPPKKTSTFFE